MSEWFFIRQKEGKMMELLKENRKIEVIWETDNPDAELPSEVKLPKEVFEGVNKSSDLNYSVCNFLSSKFGYLVSSWKIPYTPEDYNEE